MPGNFYEFCSFAVLQFCSCSQETRRWPKALTQSHAKICAKLAIISEGAERIESYSIRPFKEHKYIYLRISEISEE